MVACFRSMAAEDNQHLKLMRSTTAFIILFIAFLIPSLHAQDTLPHAANHTDAGGLKQGLWLKTDGTGKPVYRGTFRNNLPEGEFVYFDTTGKVKARTTFTENGTRAYTITYDRSGRMAEIGRAHV